MAAGTYQSVISGFTLTQFWQMILFWDVQGTPPGETDYATAAGLALDVEGFLVPVLRPILSQDCYVSSIKTERVDGAGGPSAINYFAAATYPGTRASPSLPAQVSGLLVYKTATTGPAGRYVTGKTFIPGLAEDQVTGDKINAGGLTGYNVFKGALDVAQPMSSGAAATHVLWRRPVTGPPAVAGVTIPIVNRAVRSLVATQRGRLAPFAG